jgi:hypothetical protein
MTEPDPPPTDRPARRRRRRRDGSDGDDLATRLSRRFQDSLAEPLPEHLTSLAEQLDRAIAAHLRRRRH